MRIRSNKITKTMKVRWTVSCATVVGGHATVGWLSNNFFQRFMQIGKILKKVAERSRDNRRRSGDSRLTVKQFYFDVPAKMGKFWKSRWTVTRQSSEVTRPSADCQTTFFRRFKQFGKILKKVAERSRDSRRRSRDRLPTVKLLVSTFQVNQKIFENNRWTVTRQSPDCRAHLVLLLPNWLNTAPAYACKKLPNQLNITVALLCIRMYKQSTIRTVTQPSTDCQALSVLLYYVNSLVQGAVMYLV